MKIYIARVTGFWLGLSPCLKRERRNPASKSRRAGGAHQDRKSIGRLIKGAVPLRARLWPGANEHLNRCPSRAAGDQGPDSGAPISTRFTAGSITSASST